MPKYVRPSWIEVEVDGRATDIASGPRSRSGNLYADLAVRNEGSVDYVLNIRCIADGETVKLEVRHSGKLVVDETYQQ